MLNCALKRFMKEKYSLSDEKSLEVSKKKSFECKGECSGVGIKDSSKLHQKIAFLEGKLNRIASDITRS